MAHARKPAPSQSRIPHHPDYEDEISLTQIETIRRLADPEGQRAAKRVLLYPSLV
jgi:hypothetical protein